MLELLCGKNPEIHILENVVFPLKVAKEVFVYLAAFYHFVKSAEPDNVVFRSFLGIFNHGAGCHNKRPVGTLRKQQFPYALV